MACTSPLKGYKASKKNESGKRSIIFGPRGSNPFLSVEVPCGKCISCRLEKARSWAVRCVHEAQLYESNHFVTLTYADEHLPKDGSLRKSDFQKFMKRLRRKFGKGPRYYMCGEYGEQNERPHYHACLFNLDLGDLELEYTDDKGNKHYQSKTLDKLWKLGRTEVGTVTFESAGYVARYCTKKMYGLYAPLWYSRLDKETGEIYSLLPEYTDMSRNPGIGYPWYEKFKKDLFPVDHCIVNGVSMKVPRYYLDKWSAEHPEDAKRIKCRRERMARRYAPDNTPERLLIKERVAELNFKELKREYERA